MDISAVLEDVFGGFISIWTLELYSSGGVTIRMHQFIIAAAVLILGLYISKKISVHAVEQLMKTEVMTPSVGATLRRFLGWSLNLFFFLFALSIAGIPLTFFTVIGGGLAIGIGFGAQNTINNIISGIILLFEKPIRTGDILELNGGMEGRVVQIGRRVVRVRRVDGVDMIVPTSFFLDQIVINWTIYDNAVRSSLSVGVAYGSDVLLVRRYLEQILRDNDKVLMSPSAEVLFTDFGDNSLDFTLMFWTKVRRPIDRRRVESDLRFAICTLFQKEGITIAFPQRDIHFDTPLEVRLNRSKAT
ncbi:mechanosensitive ion channel family protein [Chitinivibrio alkaliphilus]|uniref:Small-conductance mechanosensitive channel n=1 Tax=Chitinivibrio alkaliphilus ACht1 TaxID=1313304 RepID=U7DDR7_9BACT|nr:mechanosensitive ion channel domain-containing protein [Chitinivibrio alkaliphilus]ERP39041.1 small-conductance mechanosensitive channel [Chitinivibrio alkaliphilus ACht1]